MIEFQNINYATIRLSEIESLFKDLPKPLPWIEPSINMLYLNVVSSYISGNFFASLITMGILLEHVLRMALHDKDNAGIKRDMSLNELESSLFSKLINEAKNKGFIANDLWWKKVAKVLRDKSAHYIIPRLLKEFTREEYSDENKVRDSYSPHNYKLTDKNGKPYHGLSHDWGSFFHRSDMHIAKQFIIDATNEVNFIISKTNWKPCREWWESQEKYYNGFFSADWSIEGIKKNLEDVKIV